MRIVCFILFILVAIEGGFAKEQYQNDSVSQITSQEKISLNTENKQNVELKTTKSKYKPNPEKVLWMSAALPGSGQILNRNYWKVPVVYIGFGTCGYFISTYSNKYNLFRNAYKDIVDEDNTTDSYLDLLPQGYNLNNYPGGKSALTSNLKNKYELSRRYRDLSIMATIGWYALTIADAYIEAQLFDFDISPDLSLHWQPTLLKDVSANHCFTSGIQLCLNF